ncbi:MAG: hypothetical protein ABSH05_03055 [Bryobacteraceae bacterium]|jgi:hypothetical protein
MPKLRLAIDRGGSKRLEVSWKMGWKQFRVSMDGAEVGSAAGKSELREGREFQLPDGSRLHARLVKQLELLRNGRAVPGSATDPVVILNLSCGIIFFIGGASLLVGLLAEIIQSAVILGWPTALVGAVFVLLGFLVKRRSAVALAITVTLMAGLLLWRVVGSVAVVSQGGVPMGISGIFVGVMFLILICRGFGAIRQLEADEAEDARAGTSGR